MHFSTKPNMCSKNLQISTHESSCKNKDILSTQYPTCTCEPIEEVETCKYLGVYLDSKLNWNKQVEIICNKLRLRSHKLFKTKYVLPTRIKLNIYKALAESLIRYGITIYGTTGNHNLKRLKTIPKKMLRVVLNSGRAGDNTCLFRDLGVI